MRPFANNSRKGLICQKIKIAFHRRSNIIHRFSKKWRINKIKVNILSRLENLLSNEILLTAIRTNKGFHITDLHTSLGDDALHLSQLSNHTCLAVLEYFHLRIQENINNYNKLCYYNAAKKRLEMDQQFSLSWNNFHGNLSKGFAGLLGNGEFVDVTIAVEGHLLQAHKVILSICSPYFKKMFQLNPCQHPIVVLRDVTHKAMRDLLQFMYHGEVSVKREDLTSFIGTAEVLQIKGLTNKETEEDCFEHEKELSKQSFVAQNDSPAESCTSETYDVNPNEMPENNKLDLLKQKHFIEKLQRISNLKRKSEEFPQKSYYSEVTNSEKRPKILDKPVQYNNQFIQRCNYDNLKVLYDENPVDITTTLNTSIQKVVNSDKDTSDKSIEQPPTEAPLELKTECDDTDIIVTDPAVCTTPKSYDGSREKKYSSLSLDYPSPQDNCASLTSLFMDIKNIVNGKVSNMHKSSASEEFPRHALEHRLTTIPQKEDGKKKYPQRSCRLCWRIGKRRDTRFMCSACELPFCKSPCFEIHFNDIYKVSQLQGDYYAT